jgi:lipoprotein-anchoring transpeptidase ErfK/SrfK
MYMSVRSVLITLVIVVIVACTAQAAHAAAVVSAPNARQAWTAKIIMPLAGRSKPGSGHVVAHFNTVADFGGGPDVLLVLGAARVHNTEYVRLELQSRPNGSSAWVPANEVLLRATSYHITVNIGARTLVLTRAGRVVVRTKAVVGAPGAPTPTGLFAVAEVLPQPSGSVLGAYVLGTTAHSGTYKTFDGGNGQIGLHGYEKLGAPLGTAASHGCVRLPMAVVMTLVRDAGPGTPISIID